MMQEQQENQPSALETKDGYYALTLIARHKYYILGAGVLAMIVSAIVSLQMPNYYTAQVSAVPPRKTNNALDAAVSSVSSTLREFGLSKLGGKHSEGYDLIVLMQSRQVKDTIIKRYNLAQVYDLPDTAAYLIRDEFEANLTVNVEPEGNYTLTVDDPDPKRAAAIANDMIALTNQLSQQLDKRETQVIYKQFENRIASTDREINETRDSLSHYSRESKIFSPLDQVKVAAQALGEMKANIMKQEIVLSYMEQSYGKDDPMSVRQRDVLKEMQNKLSQSESGTGLLGGVSIADAPRAAVPYMHFYSQLEALLKIKAFLAPSFEQVKLDLTKESPSLYVLDEAIAPQKKSRPKRSLIVLGSFAAAAFLGCVLVLIMNQLRVFRQRFASYQQKPNSGSDN